MSDKLTAEEIAAKISERVAAEQAELADAAAQAGSAKKYDKAFLDRCFASNEVGDSMMYNVLNAGRHVHNIIDNKWLSYIGPHWDDKYLDRKALADVEVVAEQYLPLLEEVENDLECTEDKTEIKKLYAKRKLIIGRLDRLRSASGRSAVLNCVTSNANPLVVHPDELDQDEWIFPFANCVVDLRTGMSRPGRPEDYLTKCSPTEWHGIDAQCPTFMQFLWDTFDFPEPRDNAQRQDVIAYLLRVLGYSITALNKERLFIVLFGEHGQNGKGTLMEILFHVLGDLAGPIQTEMLMASRFSKGADGPSPAVLALKGRRLVWASETEEGNSFAAGKLKLYSGGDPLVGRGINAKAQQTFMPTHTLFLLCNDLPKAPAHDSAFWERIKVIDFPLSFVRRKPQLDENGHEIPVVLERHQRIADDGLMDKLKKEAPGIAAALVRGCLDWQRQGLNPPRKVINDSLKYRRKEDDIQDFIDQCCEVNPSDPECKETAKILYGRYKSWWNDCSPSREMSQKKFGELMGKKFEKIKSSGIVYLGVRVSPIGTGTAWNTQQEQR